MNIECLRTFAMALEGLAGLGAAKRKATFQAKLDSLVGLLEQADCTVPDWFCSAMTLIKNHRNYASHGDKIKDPLDVRELTVALVAASALFDAVILLQFDRQDTNCTAAVATRLLQADKVAAAMLAPRSGQRP